MGGAHRVSRLAPLRGFPEDLLPAWRSLRHLFVPAQKRRDEGPLHILHSNILLLLRQRTFGFGLLAGEAFRIQRLGGRPPTGLPEEAQAPSPWRIVFGVPDVP